MLRRASQALAFALSHSLASLRAPPLQAPLPILVLGQVSKSSTRDICQKMPRENWISFCFDLGRLAVLFILTQSAFLYAPRYPLPPSPHLTVQMRFCQSQMAYGHCLVIEKQTNKRIKKGTAKAIFGSPFSYLSCVVNFSISQRNVLLDFMKIYTIYRKRKVLLYRCIIEGIVLSVQCDEQQISQIIWLNKL